MKRFGMISISLIVIFSAISFFSISFANAVFEKVEISKISRGFLNENSIYFTACEDVSFNDIKRAIYSINQTNIALSIDIYRNARIIAIKGVYEAPPMVRGRFLNEADSLSGEKYAVIGKEHLGDLHKENYKEILIFHGRDFEVVGVMGYKLPTILDDLIIINDTDFVLDNPSNLYVIEGNALSSETRIQEFLGKLEAQLDMDIGMGDTHPHLSLFSISVVSLDTVLQEAISSSMIYVLLMLCCLICSLSISAEWVSRQHMNTAVKRLIGWDNRKLAIDVIKEYLLYCICGIFLGLAVSQLLGYSIANPGMLVSAIAIDIIFGCLAVILPVLRLLRINVAGTLR